MQRYKICQQFTTVISQCLAECLLFQICKDTKFVSNSQLGDIYTCILFIVSDMQRYKICQQFTTVLSLGVDYWTLFQICKDTKFVSNSQLFDCVCVVFVYCFRYAKIQNLSAIHNEEETKYVKTQLFQICKDTKFVSNSQPLLHNTLPLKIVSDMQRYKICQQFTTPLTPRLQRCLLFQICKDTKFVSNSQLFFNSPNKIANCFRYAKIQNLSAIHN